MSVSTGFCTREKIEKPLADFYPSQAAKGRGWCRACFAYAARQRRKGEPISDNANRVCEAPGCTNSLAGKRGHARFCGPACNAAGWREVNPTRRRDYWMKCEYGITQKQFDALLAEQGGVCASCGGVPPEVDGKYGQWNVDHCHETGAVRGILCSPCNIGLGMFGDDPLRVRRGAAYLERPLPVLLAA